MSWWNELEAKEQELLVRCAENPGLGTSHGSLKPKAKGFLKTGSERNWDGEWCSSSRQMLLRPSTPWDYGLNLE